MQLPMNISTYGNRYLDGNSISLLGKDSNGPISDKFNLFFCDRLKVPQIINDSINLYSFCHYFKIITMLSDKEIRSMIWTEFDSGELNNEEGEEQMLDLSHQ